MLKRFLLACGLLLALLSCASVASAAVSVNTALPVISGTAQQGQTLATTNGTWTNGPTSYTYRWQRCKLTKLTTPPTYGSCANTTGTAQTYIVQAADLNDKVRVGVTAHNTTGKATAYSAKTVVVTAPSNSSWPASYTTGPLGANEILPTVQGHTLLSLWSGVVGNTAVQQRAFMAQRITDMGRSPDVIGFSCSGSCAAGSGQLDVSSTDLSENWIHSQGAIPLVANWDPGSSTDFAGIAAGNYDANIDASAARFKAFGHRIMVRMFPEFEEHGSWSTTDFINAWQHIVNRFKADGATNVGFWWCPGEQAGGVRPQIDASYPGDAYVDWVGSDDYNRDSSSAFSACRSGWVEFSWEFNYDSSCGSSGSMEQEWGPRKPFFVGETGSKYDTVDINRKRNWFTNIESAATAMPYLVGVDFFDQDVHALEAGNNWRVDSPCDSAGTHCNDGSTDANTYSGFLSMTRSAQFSGGVVGGAS